MSHDLATFAEWIPFPTNAVDVLRKHQIRVGGAFKTEDVTLRSGRTYSRLATGSGGAMCAPRGMVGEMYARQHHAWRAVHPCTRHDHTGADPRHVTSARATAHTTSHIRALRPQP